MNMEQRQSVTGLERAYNSSFHKLMRMFTLSILISFIGTVVGMFIPPALFLPLVVVELIMLIASVFVRKGKRPIGYGFVFSFCFLSGITIFPTIAYYANAGGQSLVSTAFAVTAAAFGGLSFYAYFSKRNFSFLAGFLFIGLITLLGFSLVSLFTGGFSGGLGLAIAVVGVLVFSGYILYDVSQYRHGLAEENIPLAVLNLYLDFINLFLYVLRLLGIFSRD